jgi:hypothetical protein
MIRSFSARAGSCALAVVTCALTAPAWAQPFNGLKVNERVFNDYPTSTLTINNSNSVPGNVTIDDRNMTNATGNGANRHDALLSKDNGATAYTFPITEGFLFSTNLNLTAGSNTPRKEAGIRINSGVTGDVLFLVNSDAGEIVAFGGGAPFKLFGNNGTGNGYTPGTTIQLGIIYRPDPGPAPGTIEYFIDRAGPGGFETSGQLNWDNLEGGPVDFNVGVYAQGGSGNNAQDFFTVRFTDINVPEPAGLSVLALCGVALLTRRRSA